MSTRLFDQWLEMNRAALAPATRWRDIATTATDKLVRHNLAVARDYVDFGLRQAQVLGDSKDPAVWASEGGKLSAEFGQTLVNRAGDYFGIVKETQAAFGELAESSAKAAVDAYTAKAA